MLCSYVRQPRALGLGHAVLCAEHLVGREPFAVLLADDLMTGPAEGPGVMHQMVDVFARTGSSVLAVQEVPLEQVQRYGIVAGTALPGGLTDVQRMVEKPSAAQAPSRLAVAGRYVLTPGVFDRIRQGGRGAGGEIQLTDGIASLMKEKAVFAHRYEGVRYDCGNKEGWFRANVALGRKYHNLIP
jgi:UTP--glucose-1-phosphate uridylyltransferase